MTSEYFQPKDADPEEDLRKGEGKGEGKGTGEGKGNGIDVIDRTWMHLYDAHIERRANRDPFPLGQLHKGGGKGKKGSGSGAAATSDDNKVKGKGRDKNDKGDTDDENSEAADDEPLLVEVFFVGGVEIDSRTGLPWGMKQEEFDKRNAEFQKQKKERVRAVPAKGEGS